jgi:hypothetical protein
MGNLCRKKIYDLQTVYKLPHSASWHTYILPDLQKFGGCQFIRIRNTQHSLCSKPEQPIVDFTKLLLIYLLLHPKKKPFIQAVHFLCFSNNMYPKNHRL